MAAVSPIGNMIYLNQNMPVQAQQTSAQQVRFDMQAMTAMDDFVEKEKVVEEVRPAEEIHTIDPDQEHEKKKNSQQEQEEKKKEDEGEGEADEHPKRGLLDISV